MDNEKNITIIKRAKNKTNKATLKREQNKESKKDKLARKSNDDDDSSTLEDSILVNNLEKTFPHKMKENKTITIIKRVKDTTKKNEWDVDMELEQKF